MDYFTASVIILLIGVALAIVAAFVPGNNPGLTFCAGMIIFGALVLIGVQTYFDYWGY